MYASSWEEQMMIYALSQPFWNTYQKGVMDQELYFSGKTGFHCSRIEATCQALYPANLPVRVIVLE